MKVQDRTTRVTPVADRGEESTEARTGLTDEWVPAARRGDPSAGSSVQETEEEAEHTAPEWEIVARGEGEEGEPQRDHGDADADEESAGAASAAAPAEDLGDARPSPDERDDAWLAAALEGLDESVGKLRDQRLRPVEEKLDRLERSMEQRDSATDERVGAAEADGGGPESVTRDDLARLEERLATLERALEAESETNRQAVDALADEMGTRSGEASSRLLAVEQRVGEIAVELEANAEAAGELRDDLSAGLARSAERLEEEIGDLRKAESAFREEITRSVAETASTARRQASETDDRLEGLGAEVDRVSASVTERLEAFERESKRRGGDTEAQLTALERRLGEAGAERSERLAPLERGLDEVGKALERTRSGFAERERSRHESLQRSITEIGDRLDEKLKRMSAALEERAKQVSAPAPPSLPPAFPARASTSTGGQPARSVPGESEVPDGETVPIPPRDIYDLNEVTFEQLRGMGLSVTQAARLLDLRSAQDGFTSLEALEGLPGFPDALRDEIKQRLTLA